MLHGEMVRVMYFFVTFSLSSSKRANVFKIKIESNQPRLICARGDRRAAR